MIDKNRTKKALIALRAMFKNARSLREVREVEKKCNYNNIKFHLISMLNDDSFRMAIDCEQIEYFLIK